MKKVKEILNDEKFRRNISLIAFGFGALMLVTGVILDLTYSGIIKNVCAEKMIEGLKSLLIPVGFRYHTASEVIFNSMGILFTMLSLLLTVGKNLSDRYEIKVFGIPRGELEVSAAHKVYDVFHGLIFVFPFLMLICINLRFCVAGYLILTYSLLFLMSDYLIMKRSYQGNKNADYTAAKLIKTFEADSDYMEYQMLLRKIRLGIEKSDGWESAERLFKSFAQRASMLEDKECYISSYLFFDVIFCKDNVREINDSALRCIKRYICELYDGNAESCNEVIFCALMKVIFKYWEESQIYDFLKWFLDFAGRSKGGNNEKRKKISEIQLIQINIVMVMIEEWRPRQKDYRGSLKAFLESMWFQGDLSKDKDNQYSNLFEIVRDAEKILNYKEDRTIEAYTYLRQDYIENRGISFIGNTIR